VFSNTEFVIPDIILEEVCVYFDDSIISDVLILALSNSIFSNSSEIDFFISSFFNEKNVILFISELFILLLKSFESNSFLIFERFTMFSE
jgi:hypothetical protein